MGCLHVKIDSIENHISPVVSLLNNELQVTTTPPDTLDVNITSIVNPIEIQVLNSTSSLIPVLTDLYKNHLKVVCNLICSLNVKGYIEVSPEEIQWLTEDTDITYIVKSNTDWEIIIE